MNKIECENLAWHHAVIYTFFAGLTTALLVLAMVVPVNIPGSAYSLGPFFLLASFSFLWTNFVCLPKVLKCFTSNLLWKQDSP